MSDQFQSYGKASKDKVIRACDNAILKDRERRQKARNDFGATLQKPRKVWKFWPFYSVVLTRTRDEAEEYIKQLEIRYKTSGFFDDDARVVNEWIYNWEYPENLKKSAEQCCDYSMYLCTKDAIFVANYS